MLKDFKRILLLLFIIYSCSENIFSQEYFYEYGKHEDLQLTFTLRDAILENEILYMTLSFTNEDAKNITMVKPSIDMIDESVLCIWLYVNNSKEAQRIYVGDRVSYEEAQKGDILVYNTNGSGHVIMIIDIKTLTKVRAYV